MFAARLTALVLGQPGRSRVRVLMTLLTLGIYALFVLLQWGMVRQGLLDGGAAFDLSVFCLAGSTGFYVLLRTGWSERLSSEPSLMLWQNAHSVLAVIWAYTLVGPVRGVVLSILVLILAYGMFALHVGQARLLGLLSVALLALVMRWKSQLDPLSFPLQQEIVHLMVTIIVLLGVTALSIRMGALRDSLRRQKRDLEASLESLRQLATQDELTGLVNRRHMTALLLAEQGRQERTRQLMAVVLLDLDHFKKINDSFGHQVGDAVLRAFSDCAASSLRVSDVLARWGGEEFLLMLPETGQQDALYCVQRIRDGLAQVDFSVMAPGLGLTFSAGVAICQPGEPIETVIERADQALYRAKEAGRNCTVSA